MARTALTNHQSENFSDWYQEVVREAQLTEESGVRGCFILKPWGNGLWERMKYILNQRIEETGHENCYFPLLIPLSYFADEAKHVEGFAKEMAVVTHHRLTAKDGELVPDETAKLTEPLIVRPTSETTIGNAMSRWIKSYRDLPLLLNQWGNVMRWEMRPRALLRTSEFLWQEGHTAHTDEKDAMEEVERMYGVYRDFARDYLSLPVIGGAKPEHERFPGAVETLTIEAMMRDGKALQSGTSHYLGTNFANAQNIKYQDNAGDWQLAHTTSWGLSTRMVGAVVMAHGDDDGLKLPPRIAPRQVIIVPMLRGKEGDEAVLAHCNALCASLNATSSMGEPLRAKVDATHEKHQNKRWSWVKKGVPVICEIGPRDVEAGVVSFMRRDDLRDENGKLNTTQIGSDEFLAGIGAMLQSIQANLLESAEAFLQGNIKSDFASFDALQAYFEAGNIGWAKISWCRPTGEALDAFVEKLKKLSLTVRVIPYDQGEVADTCLVTGNDAVENIIVGKAY